MLQSSVKLINKLRPQHSVASEGKTRYKPVLIEILIYLKPFILEVQVRADSYQQISSGLSVLVFGAAIVSSSVLISGDQLGRVNLLYLLILFVAWPVVSLLLMVILSVIKTEKSLVNALLAIPIWPRTWLDTVSQLKRTGLFKQWLFCQSQKMALVFNAGCLLAFVFVLLFNDVTFVWRSTLLNASQVLPVLETIALPWLFIDSAQPLLSMLEMAQDSRLSLNPHLVAASAWWQYIFMAQVVYALMPRLCLYLVSRKQLLNALAASEIAAKNSRDFAAHSSTVSQRPNLKKISRTSAVSGNYVLLNWAGLPERLISQVEQVYGTNERVYSLNEMTDLASELTVINDDRVKLLIVAAWEPPMGELEDFMRQTQGIVLPLDWSSDQFQSISALHLDEWRRFCFALPNWELQLPKELS